MLIYLLRHGESIANMKRIFASLKIDPPLTEKGREQVYAQSAALQHIDFDAIYCSGLDRARESARIMALEREMEPVMVESMHEVDTGDLDGKDQTDQDNWQAFIGVMDAWKAGKHDVRFPGGESLTEVRARLDGFIDSLSPNGKPVLVIGHCCLFMMLMWYLCDRCSAEYDDDKMGHGHYSIISGDKREFQIQEFNIAPKR